MSNYNQETPIFPEQYQQQAQTGVKSFVANVFMWMAAGLGLTAIVAVYFAANFELILENLIETKPNGTSGLNILGYVMMFAPLGFVLLMSFAFKRISTPVMIALFLAFACINGVSISFWLLMYTATSVATCFFSAAAMFGVMAVMGYTTKKDLTNFGRILTMLAWGIFFALLINFFVGSEMMDYVVSIIGVMVFTGLTAYDMQKIRQIGEGIEFNGVGNAEVKKVAILGALNLYLDFINIFLFLLRLFGNRRN